MKKAIVFLVCISLVAGLLAGCSKKLPEGFDEEAVKQQGAAVAEKVSTGDFAGTEAMVREEYRSALSAAVLEESVAPLLQNMGAFERVGETGTAGATGADGVDCAVVVVIVHHENGKLRYTVYLDSNLEVIGLYVK